MDARITVLGNRQSYINHFLAEMRDVKVQSDRARFRNNLKRTGALLAYEISKHLSYVDQEITTPLGTLDVPLLEEQPVIMSILRAGLPLHDGFLDFFDHADNGFVSAYRHHTTENDFEIRVEYLAMPDLANRDLILVDPMIATGRSLVLSYKAIIGHGGNPNNIFVAGVIASDEGLEYVLRNIPTAKIFVGAVDHELTAKAYIVPGLGDAGDLAFGPKE